MNAQSVIIDYSKKTDTDLDNLADAVYKALNPNPNFTWETDAMTQFKANCDDYKVKIAAAINGGTAAVTAKNVAKEVLVDNLREIAKEVNRQAKGDLLKLVSSGLTLTKIKGKVGPLPKPTGLKVQTGKNSGDLLCIVDANNDAIMYNFYIAQVPAPASIDEWRLVPSTTRKKNIPGLKPGVQYALKCAFQGTSTELVYSDPVLIYAQ